VEVHVDETLEIPIQEMPMETLGYDDLGIPDYVQLGEWEEYETGDSMFDVSLLDPIRDSVDLRTVTVPGRVLAELTSEEFDAYFEQLTGLKRMPHKKARRR
jgi:hypothetical protein